MRSHRLGMQERLVSAGAAEVCRALEANAAAAAARAREKRAIEWVSCLIAGGGFGEVCISEFDCFYTVS